MEVRQLANLPVEVLRQRQELPLEAKIVMTQKKVREFYQHCQGDVYVSYSGGKDSTVLLNIVKGIYPDVPSVFCDTGLEYPEVRMMARLKADIVLKPKLSFREVIEKYGYPFPSKEQALYIRQYRHSTPKMRKLRWEGYPPNGNFAISKKWRFLVDSPFEFSERCCDVMKKQPFKAYEKESCRHPIIGTMACESRLRQQEYLQHGCNSFKAAREKSAPLGFWTEQDVLRYLKDSGLEYPSCYGEIVERGGVAVHKRRAEDGLHVLPVWNPPRPRTEPHAEDAAGLPEAVGLLHQQAGNREGARLRRNPICLSADAVRRVGWRMSVDSSPVTMRACRENRPARIPRSLSRRLPCGTARRPRPRRR